MSGHDWRSGRISKEIQDVASGKEHDYQPEARTQKPFYVYYPPQFNQGKCGKNDDR